MKQKMLINSVRTIISFMLLYTLVAVPQPAKACSCMIPDPPNKAYSQYDTVFSGRVIGTTFFNELIFSFIDWGRYKMGFQPSSPYQQSNGIEVTFAVSKSWKLVSTTFVKVTTGYGGSDCGYSFAPGNSYLVYASYAYGKSGNYLVTGTCGRTTEMSNAASDLAFLNTIQTVPLSVNIQIVSWKEIFGIILFVLVLFSIIFLYRKRRQKNSIV